MRESLIERALVDAVKAAGGQAYKFDSPQRCNVPDRVVVLNGHTHFVEIKAPGKKPTAAQQREHGRIAAAGGIVWVIDGLDGVGHFVECLLARAPREVR